MSGLLASLLMAVGLMKVYVEDVFSAYTYAGSGATRTITNGVDVSGKGALIWTTCRSTANGHGLVDTVRGATKALSSASTGAQSTTTDSITGFTSSGYTLGADTGTWIYNKSGENYVSLCFAKQAKFFDYGTYTGNGTSGRQISHALGQTPGMVILKRTDAGGDVWIVHHRSLGTGQIYLNLTSASDGGGDITATSSTTFTVANFSGCNQSGASYVWYAFAHDTGTDGLIQCGLITHGSSGTQDINLGWETQLVLVKTASQADGWHMLDTSRGMSNTQNLELRPNTSSAESSLGSSYVTPIATGFRFDAALFGTAGTAIYMAIRAPMKVPTDATKVFKTLTRTGTGSAASVTGVGFSPDVVLYKSRDSWSADGINSRLRGASQILYPSATAAEETKSTDVTGFTMDGFTLGSGIIANNSATTYSYWSFKRAPGFMQEVCDTGTGSAHAIDHGLAVVPELMIRKGRSGATQWEVYSAAIANTEKLVLNSTAAKATDTTAWNSTTPTSTQFTVGTGANVNTNAATYDTLLFATCAGVSKVGSYTGTGTTLQINCGFAAGARFVLIKRTDSTGDWYVWDTVRGIVSGNDPYLLLNSTAAEVTSTDYIDPYSAGFEISSSAPSAINASGGTFIFLAIA